MQCDSMCMFTICGEDACVFVFRVPFLFQRKVEIEIEIEVETDIEV